jgi:hypothetical protein
MTTDDATALLRPDDRPHSEDLDDGTYWILQLVAAVDFLRRGDRHAFTVWDAFEEALTWWTAAHQEPIPEATDSDDETCLQTAITRFLRLADQLDVDASEGVQQAVRHWVETIGQLYNYGRRWPHPVAR